MSTLLFNLLQRLITSDSISLCTKVGGCNVGAASKLLGKDRLEERAEDKLSATMFLKNRLLVSNMTKQGHRMPVVNIMGKNTRIEGDQAT